MEVTLQNTFGASLLGAVAASMLFGITLVQVYTYYRNFPNDWKFQKAAVAFLLLLDIFHATFTVVAIYHYLIDEFGNAKGLRYLSWSFKLQVALNVGIILVVQGLYAWRVYVLGKYFSLLWPCIIIILVIVGWAFGIVVVIKTYLLESFSAIHELHSVLNGVFISATAIDFAIATAICYYIQTNRTSFHGSTNSRVVRVMRYVLICGFLTSACSLSALITYTTMSTNLIFLGIDFLLPHLYLNSYLAMLNARNDGRINETTFDASNFISVNMRAIQQSMSNTDSVQIKDHQCKVCGTRDVESIPTGISIHRTDEQSPGTQLSSGAHTAV